MKNLILAFLFLLSLNSCSDEKIIGSGDITTETRNLDSFDQILLSGVFNTKIKSGNENKVIIKADDNIHQRIITGVASNQLTLDLENGFSYDDISIELELTAINVNSLTNEGVGNCTFEGFYNIDDFNLINSGVGSISLEGSFTNAIVQNSGVGNIEAYNLTGNTITIENSGVGNAHLNCTDLLQGSLSGVGSIYFKGNPTIDITDTGIGEVIDAN